MPKRKLMESDARSVRLGDVVENINDFFDRELGKSVRYVAGEHIDEGDLRVRRFGQTTDDLVPPTFNRLFKAGDVLFHSRNIRKLAQPDFDGLTGEKLFVLRSRNSEKLAQEFLPFLLQSAHFRDHVQDRWAGSTNKFLNKTPLMEFEFLLPSVEDQTRISRLLAAADSVIDGYVELIRKIDEARGATLLSDLAAGWDKRKISEVAQVVTGKTPPTASAEYWAGNVPFATPGDFEFDHGKLSITARHISESGVAFSRVVPAGSTLVVCIGSTIGKVAQTTELTALNQQINAIVCRDIVADFMYAVSTTIGSELSKRAGTTAVPIINKGEFERIQIPVPPHNNQIDISRRFFEFQEKKATVLARLRQLRELRFGLTNVVFAR